MDASPHSEPLFLIGQMLESGEQPAPNARSLPRQQRAALELCLGGERLDYRRRNGWQHPQGSIRIHDATIATLASKGMLVIVRRSQFKKHAKLTTRGTWYARTLVTQKIEATRRICADLRREESAA